MIAIAIGAVLLISVGAFFGYRRWNLQQVTVNVRPSSVKTMYELPTETELARIQSTPVPDVLAGCSSREARCDVCHCVLVFPSPLAVPVDHPAGHVKLVARIACPFCTAELSSVVADAALPPLPVPVDGDEAIHVDTATHVTHRAFAVVGTSESDDRGAEVDPIDRSHARPVRMPADDSSSHRAVAIDVTVASPAAPVRTDRTCTAVGNEVITPVVSPIHSRRQQFNTKR
jgi:hypothetical protein